MRVKICGPEAKEGIAEAYKELFLGFIVAQATSRGNSICHLRYKDWESNPSRFKRYPFPCWSFKAIEFLYEERNITANGHEALDTSTNPKVEDWILDQGHWQVEALANLDNVPQVGALIVVTWPKPKDSTGFPYRALVILP